MSLDSWLNYILKFECVAALAGAIIYEYMNISYMISERQAVENPFTQLKGIMGENHGDEKLGYEFDRVSAEEILGMAPVLDRVNHHVHLLNNYPKYTSRIDLPKGFVITGAAGVGKTLLSRYLFTQMQGEVLELKRDRCIGEPSMIKNVYKVARTKRDKSKKPVVIFRDEIGLDIMGMRDEGLNLLSELSGVNSKKNDGIFFVATTNQPLTGSRFLLEEYSLRSKESPIYRPGRLEVIEILPPNLEAKAKIFELYLNKTGAKYEGNPAEVASMIPYFQTGAFIEKVVNETFSHTSEITDTELLKTITAILMGNKQEAMLSTEQKVKVARHELGHYFIARSLGYKVAFVSVECHSDSLGYAHLCPHESDILTKQGDLVNRIKIFIGGYTAEMMESESNLTTGCIGDLESLNRMYRYKYLLDNRGVDPVYYLHGYSAEKGPKELKIPDEELKKLEGEVKTELEKYKDKFQPLAELIASKGIVHTTELEKQLGTVK